ncbi:MAG: hypothetical protein LGB70_02110 [Sulfurovum sp.]|nr:hypothetical protein [Sulfurovum sp.]
MLDFFETNKEWLFSGVGIFLLTVIYNFRFKKDAQKNISHQIAGDNSTNIQATGNIKIENINHQVLDDKDKIYKIKTQQETIARQFLEVNIKEGDFVDIPWKYENYRITLKHIIEKKFQLRYFNSANLGVKLHIDSGARPVNGGEYAEYINFNQYIIPLKSSYEYEELYSIYSHSVYEGSLSFFRCYVSHINSLSREATLNIYIINVPNSYKED